VSDATHPGEDDDVLAALRRSRSELATWYGAHRRDLPWRRSRDPYRIWVSEVMLQQTRVEVVVPYYERFLARFPDVGALAAAREAEVLALWSGLGYYGRARRLHAAARQIVQETGNFPVTPVALSRLPGIGSYTAAAVASIAFGEPVAVLDGNVERVAARLVACDGDPQRAASRRRLLAVAEALLDPADPGRSNQALMELGATVCTPRSPRCTGCPLRSPCRARARGRVEAYPRPKTRRRPRRLEMTAALVRRGSRLLLVRREQGSTLLAGTWELPWAADNGDPAADLARRYGGEWRLERRIGTVRHAITDRDIRLHLWEAALTTSGAVCEGEEAAWVEPQGIDELPTSSLLAKALALLRA
jgi:A/G-specific adenine glycosylase